MSGQGKMESRLAGGNAKRSLLLLGQAVVCILLSLSSGYPANAAEVSKPNILFILADNIQHDHFGYMNHPFIKTPALDRLAKDGVVFENAFDTTPLCSPSRASILSGAYAHNHGVKSNHMPWGKDQTTFLEHLKGSGYQTAFIGKWHMPGEGLPEMPFLDLFVSFTDRSGQGRYYNCPMVVNGEPRKPRKSYLTEDMTDYAIEFVEAWAATSEKDRNPFCMYISYKNAHPPFKAPEGVAGMYADAQVDLPPRDFWYPKTNGVGFHGTLFGSYKNKYRKYAEVITALDMQIGRLIKEVDQNGLGASTMVVFLADNGVAWGEHFHHGLSEPWEEIIRLPCVVRAPWLTPDPGRHLQQMVLNIDIAPTFLDLAGLEIPTKMDGESFVPYLMDGSMDGRRAWLLEFWRFFPRDVPTYVGVRTDTHKYVQFERSRDPMLFDLVADPGEKNNLCGTAEGDRLAPEMKRMIEELKAGKRL